jgi:predicted transposase YbfD/YdcC
MVDSIRETKDGTSSERRYYLLSLNLDAENFARSVRQHWSVENSLHWVLDVVFGEDDRRARTAHAISNLGALRRLALNMIKSAPYRKASIRSRRLIASWDPAYLKKVLGV